ncbi:MAG: Gfo/Idh/MocA family oxidoreductase [Chloroflexia bacterium]
MSGRAAHDLGVHVLDQALYLMGRQVQSISAATYRVRPRGRGYRTGRSNKMRRQRVRGGDLASAFIRMTDGSTLLLEAGWSVFGDYADDFSITLYGTEGGATMSVKNYGWEDTVRVYTETAGSPSVIIPTLVRGGGHQAVVNKFIEAIRSDEWSAHVGREGLLRTRVVDACYTSAREGREMMLAE